MKTLKNYSVAGALHQGDTGPEAQAGDTIKLFLNTAANSSFPEFIIGTLQHPILKDLVSNSTIYSISYDENDLNEAVAFLRAGDVVDLTVLDRFDALASGMSSETGARIAADTALSNALTAEATTRFNADAVILNSLGNPISTDWWVVAQDWHLAHEYGDRGITTGDYGIPGSSQRGRDAFQEIGNYRPSLGVFNGDFINPWAHILSDSQWATIRRYQALSGCPWIHSIGNHEVPDLGNTVVLADQNTPRIPQNPPGMTAVTLSDQKAFARTFYDNVDDDYMLNKHELNNEELLSFYDGLTLPASGFVDSFHKTLTPTEYAAERGYYAMFHEPTGVWHVILNPCFNIQYSGTLGGYYWGTAQRDWLQAFLNARTSTDRIAVYTHIGPFIAGVSALHWRLAEATELHNMLIGTAAKVVGIFSGHIHQSNYMKKDGLHYVTFRNAEGNNVRGEYGTAQSFKLSFCLLRWDEPSSTLQIRGFHGEPDRQLVVN